ncbi:MAG: type II toxin-antitoxin system prevent-host-death family antitoxin [Burkholderiaceae bacterium]
MICVTIPEAKSRLAELIDQVSTGEEVVVMRRGHVIARLVPGAAKSRLTSHSLASIPRAPSATVLGGPEDAGDAQQP